MRVLFVSGIDGFCHRYAVLHRSAQLRRLGATTRVRHFADPRLAADVEEHDVVFLYRVPETAHVRRLIDRARATGCAVVGAIDDLIFVPDPGLFPELEAWPEAERALWLDGVRRYRATLDACDRVVVPTEALAAEAERCGWTVRLHRNSVSSAELALGAGAAARREARAAPAGAGRDAGRVVLGYFSGTPTHDRDFAVIAPAVERALRRDDALSLLLVGPIDPGPGIAALDRRVDRRAAVPWCALPDLVAECDVSLAPLELSRRFAAAKGEIKYLEAAAVAVPVIASPAAAYRHAIRDGWNGRLAAAREDWEGAIAELSRDPSLRTRLGAEARRDVVERFAEEARGPELRAILDEALSSPRRVGNRWTAPATAQRPARTALEPDACPDALPSAEPSGVTPPVPVGSRLEQTFRAGRAGLCRVDVHTITYGVDAGHELVLSLWRDDGIRVASAREAAADAPDRGWLALEVDPQPDSAGRDYRFEIEAVGGERSDAIAFGLGRAADTGRARLDGVVLDGSLVLRGFAAWSAVLGDGGDARRPPHDPVRGLGESRT